MHDRAMSAFLNLCCEQNIDYVVVKLGRVEGEDVEELAIPFNVSSK